MAVNRHPNISASLYDGATEIYFDCPGRCRFELAEIMPREECAPCVRQVAGMGCVCAAAKVAALDALRTKLADEVRAIEAASEES